MPSLEEYIECAEHSDELLQEAIRLCEDARQLGKQAEWQTFSDAVGTYWNAKEKMRNGSRAYAVLKKGTSPEFGALVERQAADVKVTRELFAKACKDRAEKDGRAFKAMLECARRRK